MTLSELLEAIPVALVYVQADATVGAMNDAAIRLFGDRAVGHHYISVLRQPALLDQIETSLRSGEAGQVRYLGREAGRDLVFQVQVSPLGPSHGGLLLSFEDVTPFEDAREMRSDFVANVSHELRTPLTSLTGFIETLQGPAANDAEARAKFLDTMAREAGRMNRLIHDLLSLARVEDQARQRPTDPVDICTIVQETFEALAGAAAERSVTLAREGCEASRIVPGDPDQLRQVLTNLMENAIKYGREGGTVTVRISTADNVGPLRGAGVIVAVTDQGEGISPRHLGRLTERFYRIDTHRSRDMGGTGLGLAIVKHIVNRHRGRLRITSEPGQGSTFTVMLPLA